MSVPGVTLGGMVSELPSTLRYLVRNQAGVVSRSQAIRAGLTSDTIRFRITSGRWQQIHRGVYATFTGVPGRGTQLWAAVLSAGPGAALSHETAAELQGLTDSPAKLIHITVPVQRRIMVADGISLHRSFRVANAVQESSYPPRTKVQETVLDLTQTALTFDDVCGWVTRAFARKLTDEARLREAISVRKRLRWRADLEGLVTAAGGGNHSVLEFRYHRDVERAHDLPESSRQVAFAGRDGSRGRRDRVYEEYQVVVELDGRRAHPVETQWKDRARDNAAAADGQQSLRYNWEPNTRRACVTGIQVAKVLRVHGWTGRPRPCRPGCPVQQDFPD